MDRNLTDSYKHKGLRRSLVQQIRDKGITDEKVLRAIENIPRHFFFDAAFQEHAYQDKAFPIGEGQTISQPYTVAYQTSLLDVQPTDKVLEIGTGSGYQCAVLMQLTNKVYTIEVVKKLFEKTKPMFQTLAIKPKAFLGDGSQGLPAYAPYNKILVTAGAPVVPQALLEQLAVGGRLVIPVGNNEVQKMLCITRVDEQNFVKREYDDFRFVPLVGKQGW